MRSGYTASPFDGRDLVWKPIDIVPQSSVVLPRLACRDQLDIPCCTSMALCTAMEILDSRSGNVAVLSPLFHYFVARRSPAYLGEVTLRDALRAAGHDGISRLDAHDPPMTREGALHRPSDEAFADAVNRRIVAYDPNRGRARYYTLDRDDRVENWRHALSAGFPVLIGFHTTTGYWNGQGITEPPPEPSQGAHAVIVVGFDDPSLCFLVHDSRGPGFASNGEWTLGYSAVSSPLVIESWLIEQLTYDE